MKNLILAILMLMFSTQLSLAGTNRYRYAHMQHQSQTQQEEPSLLDEILGTSGSNWGVVPGNSYARHASARLNHRNRVTASVAYSHNDSSLAFPASSIVAYGRHLQASGFRVSEHPAFGGVHRGHHGWAHAAGRAIDINIGRGVKEAYNRAAGRRFDNLAASARAAGYTVLWRVAGHYDHIHIQR
jgi:hypothetical protein